MEEVWKFAVSPRTGKVSTKVLVSNFGRIGKIDFDPACIMPFDTSVSNVGYFQAGFGIQGENSNVLHRVIFFTFYPEFLSYAKDRSLVVDHINGNPLDNRLENLRLVTNGFNATRGKKSDFDVATEPHLRRIF